MAGTYILLVGEYCGDEIQWIVNVPPVTQTEPTEFISRAMMAQGGLGTPNDFYWDGFYSEVEGKPLATMENDYQCSGWWASRLANGAQPQLSELEEARMDEDFWRKGQW